MLIFADLFSFHFFWCSVLCSIVRRLAARVKSLHYPNSHCSTLIRRVFRQMSGVLFNLIAVKISSALTEMRSRGPVSILSGNGKGWRGPFHFLYTFLRIFFKCLIMMMMMVIYLSCEMLLFVFVTVVDINIIIASPARCRNRQNYKYISLYVDMCNY